MPFTPTTQADLVVDTSSAPWMEFAVAEERKGVAEAAPFRQMKQSLQLELTARKSNGPHLLDWQEVNTQLVNSFARAVGPTAQAATRALNPEINKYFKGVKTDPTLDKKGRSWELDTATETQKGWDVTPWCAAFVNWCLSKAETPRLGYATAAAWLRYGIPLACPVYGCVAIVKPGSATGSTTGHVGFVYAHVGDGITLLGGNQNNRVSRMSFASKKVLGYRWPSAMGPGVLSQTVVV